MARVSSRTKRIATGAAATLSAALFTLTSASSAQAASYGGNWTANDVKIRKGPSTNTAIVDRGYIGDGAAVQCKARGEGVFGNDIWYYVRNVNSNTGKWGYTSDYYFTVAGGANPPWC